jgi:UDPglucose 6-dehydrogenase
MNVCVFGLWHLGCVTAACVAERYQVTGIDPDAENIKSLRHAQAPVLEPGLNELIRSGIDRGTLHFAPEPAAVCDAEIVWVTFDTPVNEADEADHGYVEAQIASLFPYLRERAIVLISSQLPAGATARIEQRYRNEYPGGAASFAYSPENLRLGKALFVFRNPGRIVVGVRTAGDRHRLAAFLAPLCENIIWMSVESAEMTKHALNSFLANSIVFMNEVASLCEQVGADAKQVEQGLKTDERIGPRAYLSPGSAFAGGTLARDVAFLVRRSGEARVAVPVLAAIRESNEFHKKWPRRKLESLLGGLGGKRIAVLGLTYKPGTDTLRRSAAVELVEWLLSEEATVAAFDPAVQQAPLDIALCGSAVEAVKGADAAVVATEWPVFRELRREDFIKLMRTPIIIDANRFLGPHLDLAPPIRYAAVGQPGAAE